MPADGKGACQRADAPLDTHLFQSTSAKASMRNVWVGVLAPSLIRVCYPNPTAKERHGSNAVLKKPKEADCRAGTSVAPRGPQPGNLRVGCSYFISRKEADAIDPEYYLPNEIQGTGG